mmetsp:Transcript_42042/g.99665  ORF Transcript_42042/g.99665 Transcript_42042/m.99665 type:complete len:393 (-) Transcript_42042:1444-2622(-)
MGCTLLHGSPSCVRLAAKGEGAEGRDGAQDAVDCRHHRGDCPDERSRDREPQRRGDPLGATGEELLAVVPREHPVNCSRAPRGALQVVPALRVPLRAAPQEAGKPADRVRHPRLELCRNLPHEGDNAPRLLHCRAEHVPRQEPLQNGPRVGCVDQPAQRLALRRDHELHDHALGLCRRVDVLARARGQGLLGGLERPGSVRSRCLPKRVVVPEQVGEPGPADVALGGQDGSPESVPAALGHRRERPPDGVGVGRLDRVVVHRCRKAVQREHRPDDEHQPRGEVDAVARAELAQLLRDLAEAALRPASGHCLSEHRGEFLLGHFLPDALLERGHRLLRLGVHPDRGHLWQEAHDLHVLHERRPILAEGVQDRRGHRLLLLDGDPRDEAKVEQA